MIIHISDNAVPIIIAVILVFTGIMLIIAFRGIKSAFFPSEKQLKKKFDETVEEIPPQIIGARVIDKRMEVASVGSVKNPDHKLLFFVSFLTDDGETKEHMVTKEIYEKCEIYQTGDLVTYNDIFFDFGEGEPIE